MDIKFSDLVFSEKLFDEKILAYYEGTPTYSRDDLKYALIITYHPAIIDRFKKIRTTIDGYPFAYSNPKTFKDFYVLDRCLREIVGKTVERECTKLIRDLKLGENWETPIFVKLCTDVLPIPYASFRFRFVGANLKALNKGIDEEEGSPKNLKELPSALALAMEVSTRLEDAKYPYIAIKEKLTNKRELINYIDKIFDVVIKPATSMLPVHKHKKADLERLMLSVWFFNLRNNRNLKPKQIEKMIEIAENGGTSFEGYEVSAPGISKLIDEARVKMAEILPF